MPLDDIADVISPGLYNITEMLGTTPAIYLQGFPQRIYCSQPSCEM
jgi:hypothetical protein